MDRVVKGANFKGTTRLLILLDGLEQTRKEDILKYIASLEQSQEFLTRQIEIFWQSITVEVSSNTHCYFCHGQECERCVDPKGANI